MQLAFLPVPGMEELSLNASGENPERRASAAQWLDHCMPCDTGNLQCKPGDAIFDASHMQSSDDDGTAMPRALDIGEDIEHQRKVWKLERLAWMVMAGSIVAAICGFAGHGLFSQRSVAPRDGGFVVDYQRFERYHAQTQLTLHLTGDTAEETRIRFGADFLRNVEVMRLEPEPERAELGADVTAYVFNTNAAGRIVVHYKPLVPGRLPLVLGRDDAPLLYLEQFVYP